MVSTGPSPSSSTPSRITCWRIPSRVCATGRSTAGYYNDASGLFQRSGELDPPSGVCTVILAGTPSDRSCLALVPLLDQFPTGRTAVNMRSRGGPADQTRQELPLCDLFGSNHKE